MQFHEALKILGLELGRGDKVKINPFNEINEAYEIWHESAMWLNRASTPSQMEYRREIERADWDIMNTWEGLTKFFCQVCGYVVSPDRYHRHCPDCKRLLSRKEYQLSPGVTGIIEVVEACPQCGEAEVSIID